MGSAAARLARRLCRGCMLLCHRSGGCPVVAEAADATRARHAACAPRSADGATEAAAFAAVRDLAPAVSMDRPGVHARLRSWRHPVAHLQQPPPDGADGPDA